MNPGRTKINHRAEQAIAALLTAPNLVEAATRAGVSESTLTRWLRRPGFQRRYRLARRQIVEGVIGRLQAGCTDALETLHRSLHCGVPSVELRAALGFLGLSLKGI
jgi:hypothetical protein